MLRALTIGTSFGEARRFHSPANPGFDNPAMPPIVYRIRQPLADRLTDDAR